MKQKMNFGRRGLALFVSLLMCLSFLPGRAMAASNFNITYRVYNETTGASRVIATDNSVSRPDSGYIQVSFQVPYLSSLTSDNYGRVTKVTSNAYFSGGSTGSGNEGASCNLSRNNPNITFTYWVTGWPSAAQDPNAGTGSGSSDNVSIGSGSGRYYINATLVYHSNYPNGKDITKSYTYSGQNFTAIYNIFTLKSYDNDLGFSYAGYSYTGWYSDKNCSSSIGNIGLENGNTYHVYAGWESNTPEPDPIEPVTLIYMDRGSRYEQQTHFEGDVPTAIDCVNTNSGYRFSGWDTDSSADSVVYEVGDGVSLSGEVTTLYAVWECAHDHDGNGYCTDPNCDHDDTCCPKPGHNHEDDDHDGKCDDPDCGECLHDHDSDGTCTDPDCTHDDECCPKKQVTVTFDTNSGRWDRGDMDTPTSHSMTLRLGAAVGARVFPVNPVRTDYIFAGWNTDKDGNGDAFAADTPVMSDITVYSQWTALPTEVPAPSLKTSKTILNLSNEVDSGAPVVYQVIVMNNGNCDLENVSVLDTLPEGLTFDRFVDGLGTTDRLTNIAKNQGQNRGQFIAWRVGELAKGESLVFTYRAIAENEGDEQITLTNNVQARGDAKGAQSTGRSRLLSAGDDFWDWINDSQNNGTVGDGSSADIIVNPNPDPDPNPDPNPNPNPDPNPDPNPNPNPDPNPDPNPNPNPDPDPDPNPDPNPNPNPDPDPNPNPNPNPDPDPTPGGDDPYIPDDPTPTTPAPAPADPGTEIADEETPLAGAIGLNSDDHFAYIVGYEDNTVRPLNEISRAEVATIFFRLMTEEYRQLNWATTNSFSDVKEGDWYNNAISTCAKAGLLAGYEDGTFRPDDPITRAEFATIAARFLEETVDGSTVGDFTDTVGHWASADIRRAVVAGWISGDGSTFRPDENIIRADVMVIVNKMLDRTPDAEHFLPDMIKWSDNPEGTWYYEAVQEATNQHNYERDEENVETWTELTEAPKWAELEKQWADNNGASAQLSWRMPDGI